MPTWRQGLEWTLPPAATAGRRSERSLRRAIQIRRSPLPLLQHFVTQMDASFALGRLLPDGSGQPRPNISNHDKEQARG